MPAPSRNRRNRSRAKRARAAATPAAANGAALAADETASAPTAARPRASVPAARKQAPAAKTRGRERGTGRRSLAAPAPVRPRAPWHPLPLAEILIVAGIIGVAVGVIDGPERAAPALFAGLAAVALGTVDVTLREHLAGFRSHAILLAVIAVIALHTAIVLSVAAVASFPRAANVALLALDIAVFAALYRVLRVRFAEARRARAAAAPR